MAVVKKKRELNPDLENPTLAKERLTNEMVIAVNTYGPSSKEVQAIKDQIIYMEKITAGINFNISFDASLQVQPLCRFIDMEQLQDFLYKSNHNFVRSVFLIPLNI